MYYIIIKTQFEGFHRYKDAPEEVKFLREYHRHIFKVEARIKTTHADRQIEFFILKRLIDGILKEEYENKEFDLSCEQIAENIFMYLKGKNLEVLQVEVSEDGENVGGYNE